MDISFDSASIKKIFDNYLIHQNGYIINELTNAIIYGSINKETKQRYVKINLKNYSLHKLIAKAFIPGYDEKNHKLIFKNNDFSDCSLKNLDIKNQKNLDIDFQSLSIEKIHNLKIGKRKQIDDNLFIDSNGYIFDIFGNLKKHRLTKSGFKIIDINGKTHYIHKMVAMAFIPGYDHNMDLIRFKDSDKNNCSLENLTFEKNKRITKFNPTIEMQNNFENENPYRIVNGYIRTLYDRNKMTPFLTNSSYTDEDLKQHLITYLWKCYPSYYLTKKNKIKFYNYAFKRMQSHMKTQEFWQNFNSFRSVIQTDDNTFDIDTISISYIEYYKTIIQPGEKRK
jgi:hypothetical protein